jgi:UDP-3-O-[3-hydroxymyristoyl] glucosamine N-acyltransferase
MNHHFFKKPNPLSIAFIAEQIGARIDGDENAQILDIATLDKAGDTDITFFHNPKYVEQLKSTKATAVILEEKYESFAPSHVIKLISTKPYRAFGKVATLLYPKQSVKRSDISPHAFIDETAMIGNNVVIEPFVVIKKGVKIGDRCIIRANTVIGENVVIGENTTIEANVTIDYCFMGSNVYIKPGCRIGQPGFGFHMDAAGHFDIPQLGCVIIEDDVQLGANTTVDRGSQSDTIIKKGVRIDNLVQVAHNVEIGENCVLAAQVGISGSTTLGKFVMCGGQVGMAGHIKVGNGVQIVAQSGLMRNIPDNEAVAGSPCVPVKDFHRQTIALKNLVKKKGI